MMPKSISSSRSAATAGRSWRTSSPCSRSRGGSPVRRCRSEAPESTSRRNRPSSSARAEATSAALRPAGAGRRAPGHPNLDERSGRARRERHRHLATGRAIGKGQRLGAAHALGRSRVRDLAHQGEDLRVGERLLRERSARAVRQQHRRLADGELQGVRALLVQDLNQTIEPGHRQSQSRGRARRTRDLLMYQLTSSVPSVKKMPAPLRKSSVRPREGGSSSTARPRYSAPP